MYKMIYGSLESLLEVHLMAIKYIVGRISITICKKSLDGIPQLAEIYIKEHYLHNNIEDCLYADLKENDEEFGIDWQGMRDEIENFGQKTYDMINEYFPVGEINVYLHNKIMPELFKWSFFWKNLSEIRVKSIRENWKIKGFSEDWIAYNLHTDWEFIYKLYNMIEKYKRAAFLDVIIKWHRENSIKDNSLDAFYIQKDLLEEIMLLRRECYT